MTKRRTRQNIPSETAEQELRSAGFQTIAGVDEVGRGAWAGPLVVSAVVLPPNRRLVKLRDSKQLSRREREVLARRIKRLALAWAIGVVEISELNQWGLSRCLSLAFKRAIARLAVQPNIVLVDGPSTMKGLVIPQRAIVKGDQKVRAIAAAAVVAKVERDRMLRTLHRTDRDLRRFRFDLNKGYPSPWHKEQLARFGPSPHHRLQFAPIQRALNGLLFGLEEKSMTKPPLATVVDK